MSCYLPYERKDRTASARWEWATCCARRLQTLPLPNQVAQQPRGEKYLDLVVKPLLPASFPGVSRATKEYRALDHGNAKFWCKGRWEGWARLFAFPMILCAEPKSLQSLSITNSLERARVRGSLVTIDVLTETAAILN